MVSIIITGCLSLLHGVYHYYKMSIIITGCLCLLQGLYNNYRVSLIITWCLSLLQDVYHYYRLSIIITLCLSLLEYILTTWSFTASFILIYLLTAIGLSPGGSSTVHIYTQTIHRTIKSKQYIECHVLASYTLAFALQPRKKQGKPSVRVAASILFCITVYMVVCFVFFYLILYIMYSYCYICSVLYILFHCAILCTVCV